MPDGASAADLVRQVALAMADVGGAIGPLYSTGLGAVATAIDATDGSSAGPVALLRHAAEEAERAVVELGHARLTRARAGGRP